MKEREEFARQLGAESEEEVRVFAELAADIAMAGPPLAPPPALKQRLLARIAEVPREPEPGIFLLKAGGMEWKPTRHAGVEYKSLFYDRESRMRTVLLRLAPGASYPRHLHKKPEQCLVLRGEVEITSGVTASAGDFEWAMPGTLHSGLSTRTGCELLIMASAEDEVMD